MSIYVVALFSIADLLFSASTVAQRPIIAVYHHVRRMRHPMRLQGPWKRNENDLLKQSVKAPI